MLRVKKESHQSTQKIWSHHFISALKIFRGIHCRYTFVLYARLCKSYALTCVLERTEGTSRSKWGSKSDLCDWRVRSSQTIHSFQIDFCTFPICRTLKQPNNQNKEWAWFITHFMLIHNETEKFRRKSLWQWILYIGKRRNEINGYFIGTEGEKRMREKQMRMK